MLKNGCTGLALAALLAFTGSALAQESNRVVASPAKSKPWVVLSAGFGTMGSRRAVSAGYGRNMDRQKAIATSLAQCNSDGVFSCETKVIINNGCYYIAISEENTSGSLGWGTGTTKQAAYDKCYSQSGVTQCDTKVIGGCAE